MFTGIIEKTAKVKKLTRSGNEYVLTIENPFGLTVSTGDSVSVDGVCLTVEKFSDKEMTFFVSESTVSKTIASDYNTGAIVNLERAMRADGRFDGHIVQGHVDTAGVVSAIRKIDKGVEMKISFNRKFSSFIAERGSVAVNGISLTCAEIESDNFSVSLIPETLAGTTFLQLPSVGKKVNIEFDIIGKYVSRIVRQEKKEDNLKTLLEKL
jgi:riboflavin synthase